MIRMWETADWKIANDSWSGNPFDLIAEVTFQHLKSKERIKTQMFYAGNDIWQFRFAGTRLGKWQFETESNDGGLDGLKGEIIVNKNADPLARGFLTHVGNQFAIQSGNDARLEAYRFSVYMNEKQFQNFDSKFKDKPGDESPVFKFEKDETLRAYLDDAANNGFEIVYLHPGYPHVWTDGKTYNGTGNPRLRTFDLIDKVITAANNRGMRVHIWMWGDATRRATPELMTTSLIGKTLNLLEKALPGKLYNVLNFCSDGINGPADRRLQRYIAARLGPLPGWSMGYGFDLHEWIDADELNNWASYLHEHFGWDHLLAARGFVLKGKNNINSYDGFGRGVPLAHSKYGPKGYAEILEDLNSDKKRPHFYAERHTYKRPHFKLDMKNTRRLMWRMMMAGGMGGWFGFYQHSAPPYPNPEQLRCMGKFWKKYFQLEILPHGNIPSLHVLSKAGENFHILYCENSDRIIFDDFIKTPSDAKAVAVDTCKAYREIRTVVKITEKPEIVLPYMSDWAVVVGS